MIKFYVMEENIGINGGAGPFIGKDELREAFKSFEIASQKLSENYKNLEEEIKDLKENLSTVLESLPLGIIITDEKNRVKFINKFLTELMAEYDLVSYLNKDIEDFIKMFFSNSKTIDFIKPIFNPIEKIMKIGEGKHIHIFLYTKAVYGNNRKYSGRIFIFQNIEEIKKFKRLAELGEMSAKIAHEIRNPLGSIDLFASILQKELNNEGHKEIVSNIVSAVKNMNATITNILEFSKALNPSVSKYNLREIIDKSLIFASYLIKQKNIRIIKEIDDDLILEVDENLLGQAFLNILINAAHAVPENGGLIRITSRFAGENAKDGESNYVCIDFEDNGMGFSKDIIQNIFNPFFSTKKSGGTGLGLPIALNNVIIHGGYINAENSSEMNGAKISVFLPALA
ncbi:MAG: ATP-binding protein [Deltaproteobacteria bacterium]|jgi:signal transduction histidine kinase|nr:ATP-binding protein [Deltaproteobacteria bacterium]MCL5879658.1 ATP-binding protein [Deltaproteobacteria bacterium]MDA8304083.1 ATP-binding protein [Deltaproteobacteria bacterium]